MSEKTEKLNSALEHTREAMREIGDAAFLSFNEPPPMSDEFKSLGVIYQLLRDAAQKMLELEA